MKINPELLLRGASDFGITLNEKQIAAFSGYCNFLLERNRMVNLTAITNPDEVVSKHFVDSLAINLAMDMSLRKNLIDIGSGAGFPGVAIKIAFPAIKAVLVESIGKKALFLDELAHKLGLSGVSVLNSRAEDLPRLNPLYGNHFEVATARAVGNLQLLLSYAKPLLAQGGSLVLWKGRDDISELPSMLPKIEKLGFNLIKAIPYKIPLWQLERFLVHLKRL
ncbi:MAG: 16S rRNA (guanine(527)-N(7))-methyltransferase RsmG [Caldisericales bacterium]|nr:16S rRNA (guanine(527)-N(7))-methyltransferase RsmG [Caldisericales bacterium]